MPTNPSAQLKERLVTFFIGIRGLFDGMFEDLNAWGRPEPSRLHKRRNGWLLGLRFRLWIYVIKVGVKTTGREWLDSIIGRFGPSALLPDRDRRGRDVVLWNRNPLNRGPRGAGRAISGANRQNKRWIRKKLIRLGPELRCALSVVVAERMINGMRLQRHKRWALFPGIAQVRALL